jgi:hypothetical protein
MVGMMTLLATISVLVSSLNSGQTATATELASPFVPGAHPIAYGTSPIGHSVCSTYRDASFCLTVTSMTTELVHVPAIDPYDMRVPRVVHLVATNSSSRNFSMSLTRDSTSYDLPWIVRAAREWGAIGGGQFLAAQLGSKCVTSAPSIVVIASRSSVDMCVHFAPMPVPTPSYIPWIWGEGRFTPQDIIIGSIAQWSPYPLERDFLEGAPSPVLSGAADFSNARVNAPFFRYPRVVDKSFRYMDSFGLVQIVGDFRGRSLMHRFGRPYSFGTNPRQITKHRGVEILMLREVTPHGHSVKSKIRNAFMDEQYACGNTGCSVIRLSPSESFNTTRIFACRPRGQFDCVAFHFAQAGWPLNLGYEAAWPASNNFDVGPLAGFVYPPIPYRP